MFEAIEMLLGSTLGGAGLFLLIDGLRGRREGREPRCAKCGYSLMGRVEGHNRCPECGSWLDLSGAIHYGDSGMDLTPGETLLIPEAPNGSGVEADGLRCFLTWVPESPAKIIAELESAGVIHDKIAKLGGLL